MKFILFFASIAAFSQVRVNAPAIDLSATAVAAAIDHMNSQLTRVATPLAADIDSTVTVISVESASGIGANAVLKIEGEHLQVVSISGTDITVTRGANGTTAAAHFFRQLVADYPPVTAPIDQVKISNAAALEAARATRQAVINAAVQ